MRAPPPTPAQVAAHRYTGARLRAALVAREPVPGRDAGRDPARTSSRALAAGAVLAALGVAAAAVVGVVRGDADWRAAAVVRGVPSGQLYAVAHGAHGPDRLVPTLNLASARLLADAASGTDGADPVAVRDDALTEVPRSAPAGIPGAPATLPAAGTAGTDDWAVCDAVRLDPSVPDPEARPARTSVVLGGVERDALGRVLAPGEALLARGDDGAVWLVQDGRRARVDPGRAAVLAALDLARVRPRVAGPGFLRALPEAPPLAGIAVPAAGTAPVDPAVRALGVPVGSVVTGGPAGADGELFLVLRDGVQPVPAVVAQLVRFTDPDPRATAAVTPEDPAVLAAAPRRSALDLAAYPSEVPRPVGYDAAAVVCAHPDPDPSRPAVVTASDVLGAPVAPTPLDGVPGLDGALVVGAGAWVAAPGGGAGLVVDPAGRAYPVPTTRAAAALGLGPPHPAPGVVLDLLPRGPALDPDAAVLLR